MESYSVIAILEVEHCDKFYHCISTLDEALLEIDIIRCWRMYMYVEKCQYLLNMLFIKYADFLKPRPEKGI